MDSNNVKSLFGCDGPVRFPHHFLPFQKFFEWNSRLTISMGFAPEVFKHSGFVVSKFFSIATKGWPVRANGAKLVTTVSQRDGRPPSVGAKQARSKMHPFGSVATHSVLILAFGRFAPWVIPPQPVHRHHGKIFINNPCTVPHLN